MTNENNIFGEVISSHTSDQAVADGYLFSVKEYYPEVAKATGIYFVTRNLIEHYGFEDGDVQRASMIDLCNQCVHIMKKAKTPDEFYAGNVENRDGATVRVFISRNEHGAFTAMLPEDN